MTPMDKTLVVSQNCDACKVLLESLKNQGVLDKYRVVDVATPEGKDVVEKLGITGVPECIMIMKDQTGEMARRCTPEEMTALIKEASGEKTGTR
jgi:predicted thioredoxin/glutaredoxin